MMGWRPQSGGRWSVGGDGGGWWEGSDGWGGGSKHNRDPLRCFKKGRKVFKGGSPGSEAGLCEVSR